MAEPWPGDLLEHFLRVAPPKAWPAGAWKKVVRTVAAGGSYEQAAAKAGVSKNAVVGAAHRARFPARPSPIQFGVVPKPRVRAQTRDRVETPPPAPKPVAVQAPPPRPAPPPTVAPVKTTRDGRGCRFPIGDPRTENFRFCGAAAVIKGSSYCPQHHALCYTRTAAEVQRAAEVAREVVGTADHRPFVTPRAA